MLLVVNGFFTGAVILAWHRENWEMMPWAIIGLALNLWVWSKARVVNK